MTQSYDADALNDRRNQNVDRSEEATLAREDAAVEAALAKEAQQSQQQQEKAGPEAQKEAQQEQKEAENSEAGPGAEPQPGASLENESVHQITSADVKRQEKCDEKIAMMIPDPDQFVQSALKGIQTAIQNMTAKLDKYLQALQSYVDAVSNVIADIQKMMSDIACQIANFMKQIFDKIMEYAMKILNKALNAVVAAMPSSLRYQFSDMKQVITELILCLYGKMSGGLCDKIAGILDELIDPSGLVQETQNRVANQDSDVGETTYPQVPICFAEDVAGRVLAGSKKELDSANQNIANNVDAYLKDITGMLAGITDVIDPLSGLASGSIDLQIPDIAGSITSALSFANISLNIFGCELKPNIAKSTIYTFCQGGDEQAASQMPSEGSVDERSKDAPVPPAEEGTPFAEPTAATEEIDNTTAGQDTGERYKVDPETTELVETRPATAAEKAEKEASSDALQMY